MTLLMRNEIALNTKTIATVIGAVFGLLLLVNVASVRSSGEWEFHLVFFPLVLLIGGHIITSMSFRELHNKQKGYTFLTLPASQGEKYLSKLFITSIGYTAAVVCLYLIFSLLATGITELFFNRSHGVFNPFHHLMWRTIGIYIATHSVTFFCAVFFKRLQLLNEVLWLNILGIGFGVIAVLLAKLVFWNWFPGFFTSINFDHINIVDPAKQDALMSFFQGLLRFTEILFYYIAPVFFWITGYFRLRETEV
jgi:hypothetical protein